MPVKVKSPLIDFYGMRVPFRCGLFGSSRTGKSTMIFNLLEHSDFFDKDFDVVYYCYPSVYYNGVDWHEKLDYTFEYLDRIPNRDYLSNMEPNSVVILEDCWFNCCSDPNIRDLFKVLSGKRNISIFITSQNPYEGGTNARTIRNNLNYYFLFRNLGDEQINRRLCQQLGLLERYENANIEARKRKFGSVFLNLDVQLDHEELRVSSDIFNTPVVTF